MANRLEHQLVGAGAGFLAGLPFAGDSEVTDEERLSLGLTSLIAGGVGGRVPDIIEPAIHPNHRKVFHSVVVMMIVIWGIIKVSGVQPRNSFERHGLVALNSFLAGYLSHLELDASTPKSIPFI